MAKKELEKQTLKYVPGLCDIHSDTDKVILELEMPGVSRENLDVRVENDRLLIQGHRAPVETQGTYLLKEMKEGDYRREFTLDETIDRSRIEASLDKGILTVQMHIKESEKPRKIQVKAG